MAKAMNKKGIEMQFHWIFILIAGAIILAFFFAIVSKQKDISDQKIAISLSNDIEALAAGAGVSRGSVQPIPLPKVEIEFSCSETCDCTFSPGAGINKQFKDNLLFAPSIIEGNEMLLWTEDWNIPFRVSNLVYITNDRVQYVIVSDQGNAIKNRLQDRLPEEIDVDYVTTVAGYEDKDFDKVKFIFIDQHQPQAFPPTIILEESLERIDTSAISVTGSSVTFYSKKSKRSFPTLDRTTFYVNDESLLGAMFAEDINMYDCNIQQAFKRMGYVANISAQRAIELQSKQNEFLAKGLSCNYATQIQNLNTLAEDAQNAIAGLSQSTAASINNLQQTLDNENRALLQQSCPTIY